MITLTPAYGRDYRSVKTLKADIATNKDFVFNDYSSPDNGRYCSPSDFKHMNIKFRYNKMLKAVVIKL